MATTPSYKIKKTDTLYQYYEELEEEMNECYFSSNEEENKKRTEENSYNHLFDSYLENNLKASPSNDLLRELHTICKDPETNRLIEVQIERIIRQKLSERKEKAKQKVIEVYRRIKEQEPTQTEKVA